MQLFSTGSPDPANKNAISIGPPFTLKLKVSDQDGDVSLNIGCCTGLILVLLCRLGRLSSQ